MCNGSSWDGGIVVSLGEMQSRCASDARCVGFYQSSVLGPSRCRQRGACAYFRPVSAWQGQFFKGSWSVFAAENVSQREATTDHRSIISAWNGSVPRCRAVTGRRVARYATVFSAKLRHLLYYEYSTSTSIPKCRFQMRHRNT